MKFLSLVVFVLSLSSQAGAQPFIGKTELYIKSNINRTNKYIYGSKTMNGERQLSISDDSSRFDYLFSNADHLCYQSIYTPLNEDLLQQAIASNDEHLTIVRKGKEWLLHEGEITITAKLQYFNEDHQFALIYRRQKR